MNKKLKQIRYICIKVCILFLIHTLLPLSNLNAQDTLKLDSKTSNFKLKNYLHYWENKDSKVPFKDIQKHNHKFKPFIEDGMLLYPNKFEHWMRLKITNKNTKDLNLIFSLFDKSIYKIDFYFVNELGEITQQENGTSTFNTRNDYLNFGPYFKFELQGRENATIYVCFTSRIHVTISPSIIQQSVFNEHYFREQQVYSFFYGVICIFIAYAVIFFITTGFIAWVYLAFFSLFLSILAGTFNGYTPYYLNWLVLITNGKYDVYIACFTFISSVLYIKDYLETNIRFPQYENYLKFLIYVPILIFLVNIFNFSLAINLLFAYLSLYFFMLSFYAYLYVVKNIREGYFFIGGFLFFYFFVTLNIVLITFASTANPVSDITLHIGLVALILILCWGMTDKINQTNKDLHLQIEKNIVLKNEELAQKVSESTKQLAIEKSKLDLVLESTPDLVYSLDTAYSFTTMNSATKVIFEKFYNIKISIGDKYTEIVSGRVLNLMSGYFERAFLGENIEQLFSLDWYDEMFHRQIYINPIWENDNKVIGVAVFSKDVTEAQNARLNLQYSEILLENTFDQSPDALFLVDGNSTKIIRANQQAQMLYEATDVSSLVGLYSNELYSKPFIESEISEIYKTLKENNIWTGEHEQQTLSGNVFWGVLKITEFEINKVIYQLVRVADVTDRKNNEQIIIQKEANLRVILESNDQAIWLVDTNNRLIDCNRACLKMFRDAFGTDIAINIDMVQAVGNHYRLVWHKRYQNTLQGKYENREDAYLYNDKNYIYQITSFPIRDNGVIQRASFFARDITAKVLAEKELKESQKVLSTINLHLKDALFRSKATGELLYANTGFMSMFGYEKEEIKTLDVKTLYQDPEIRNKLQALLTNNGTYIEQEVLMKRKNGSTFWVSMSTTKNQEENNEVYYDGIMRDITQARKAKNELQKRNKMLKKANAQLDRFIYSASHELVAPLKSVFGLFNIMKYALTEDEKQDIYEKMFTSIQKLEGVIIQIETQALNSRTPLKIRKVNLKKMLDKIVQDLQHLPNNDKVKQIFNITQTAPLFSDVFRLELIVNNLISNAICYANLQQESPQFKLNININPEIITIIMSDNGQGMSEDSHQKMFKMFHRGSESSVGSGIGLYILKEALQILNGTVDVNSVLGIGTTLILHISNKRFEDITPKNIKLI